VEKRLGEVEECVKIQVYFIQFGNICVARVSGCIVNACNWIEGAGYDLILFAAKVFKIDVVLV